MEGIIKIVLADSEPIVRQGIFHILENETNVSVVGEVNNSAELFELLKNISTNILVIDYNHDQDFELGDIQTLKVLYPNVNIMVISSDISSKNINRSLEYGANSYLTKRCGKEEIVDAVKATAKGEKFFCNKVLDLIVEREIINPVTCEPTILSKREVEILQEIAGGLTTAEIASKLCLSIHTVNTHRKNIIRKMKFRNKLELYKYAVQISNATSEKVK